MAVPRRAGRAHGTRGTRRSSFAPRDRSGHPSGLTRNVGQRSLRRQQTPRQCARVEHVSGGGDSRTRRVEPVEEGDSRYTDRRDMAAARQRRLARIEQRQGRNVHDAVLATTRDRSVGRRPAHGWCNRTFLPHRHDDHPAQGRLQRAQHRQDREATAAGHRARHRPARHAQRRQQPGQKEGDLATIPRHRGPPVPSAPVQRRQTRFVLLVTSERTKHKRT